MLQEDNLIANRKNIKNIILICVISIVIVFLGVYISIGCYYKNRFIFNTWINGHYCTGLTPEEALRLVATDDTVPDISIIGPDNKTYVFDMSNVEYSYDYGNTIYDMLLEQNSFSWLSGLGTRHEYSVKPRFSVAKEDLHKAFLEFDFVVAENNLKPDYLLFYSEEKGCFDYIDNLKHRLDSEMVFEEFYNGVMQGENTFTVDSKYYFDHEPNAAQCERITLYNKLVEYQTCDLVYDMGAEKLEFGPSLMLGFLIYDGEFPAQDSYGSFLLDDEKIYEWVDNLCEAYDTYEKVRYFNASRGEVVEIAPSEYGTLLDGEAEKEYLIQSLLEPSLHDGIADIHIPEYLITAYARGLNDIGDTFIEVDITNQHLYFYEKGTLIVESDIVTGNLRTRNSTIKGCYTINNKEENRYLLGADYTSFVNYWMPFFKNYGINDSTWRDEYGGEIYKTRGSHGTINVPLEVAQVIYEHIELGIPIVIFD